MQISLININEIKQAHRFDAEYFKPECIKVENRLKKINSVNFGSLLKIITGGATPLGAQYEKDGIPFLRVQNIMQNYFNDDLVYINKNQDKEIKRSKLIKGDVLLTITGVSYGKAAVVEERYNGANINQHSVLMRFEKKLNPYFISTFLNCKYGKTQSDKNIVGLSRPALDYKRIKDFFLIPVFTDTFQTQIESLVKQAHAKQEQSKQLYKEAEKILLQELNLLNYVPQNNLIFSTTKKHIEKIKRFDAEYFQPKYKKIIEKIELYKGGVELIKNIVKWEKGVEVGADCYVEKGFDFVRVSDFNKYGINEIEKKISDKTYHEFKEKFEPKIGDILFTKDGTIGMSYVLKENIQGLLSGAFLRLTLKKEYKDFEKESLVLILNSIVCKMQVEQLSGGALIAHLKPSDFETFKIPLIKKEIQTNIAEKIKLSFRLKKESKELLEKAKKLVELEIEK